MRLLQVAFITSLAVVTMANSATAGEVSRVVQTLGVARLDVPGEVQHVTVSPDGLLIATLSEAPFSESRYGVCLFDAATGKRLQSLPIERGSRWPGAFRFSPDSKQLFGERRRWQRKDGDFVASDHGSSWLTVSADGRWAIARGEQRNQVQLWNVSEDKSVAKMSIPVETNGIETAALTADGKVAALGTYDGQLQLWDAQAGKKLHTLKLPAANFVTDVEFSPDGKKLVACGYFAGIPIFDVASGKSTFILPGHERGPHKAVAFSPDGRQIATGSRDDGRLRLWDADTGRETASIRAVMSEVNALAYSPDGKSILVGGKNHSGGRTLRAFDAASGEERFVDPGPQSNILRLAYSPEGNYLAACTARGKVFLWDIARGRLVVELPGNGYGALRFSPDGWILTAVARDGSYRMWEADTADLLIARDDRRSIFEALAVTRQLDRLAVGGRDGKVTVHEMISGKTLRSFQPATAPTGEIKSLAFSLDGEQIAVSVEQPRRDARIPQITVHDAKTGKLVQKLATKVIKDDTYHTSFSSIQFSGDGTRLLAHSEWCTLHLWDLTSGSEVAQLSVDRKSAIDLSPDGKYLAHVSNGTLALVELATHQICLKYDSGVERVSSLAISPDGQNIAAALANQNVVQVWSTAPSGFDDSQHVDDALRTADWEKLLLPDAEEAYLAIWQLAGGGNDTVKWLEEKLDFAADAVDVAEVNKWIVDLDDDEFAIRQAASEKLRNQGVAVLPLLEKSLRGKLSPEAEFRVKRIVAVLKSPIHRTGGSTLRNLRAVEVLERINTRGAHELIARQAKGPDDSRSVLDARAALVRMQGRARGR